MVIAMQGIATESVGLKRTSVRMTAAYAISSKNSANEKEKKRSRPHNAPRSEQYIAETTTAGSNSFKQKTLLESANRKLKCSPNKNAIRHRTTAAKRHIADDANRLFSPFRSWANARETVSGNPDDMTVIAMAKTESAL